MCRFRTPVFWINRSARGSCGLPECSLAANSRGSSIVMTYSGTLTDGLHSVDMPGIYLLVRERSSLYSPGAARAANGKISHDTAATAHLHGPRAGSTVSTVTRPACRQLGTDLASARNTANPKRPQAGAGLFAIVPPADPRNQRDL